MKFAIYTRVSTNRQNNESQIGELRDFCNRRGWTDVAEFTDQISGAKFTRSGLEAMMNAARRGRIDAVICYKLDRLGRSLAHLAQIIGELTANNVALVVPTQGIDTSESNPAGRLQLGVLMAVAEFEREIIRERVVAGLEAAKKRGQRLGRPDTIHLHLDAARALRAQGKGIRAIARELKIAPASVSKLVKKLDAALKEAECCKPKDDDV